jgi:hypothetical protein
MVRYSVDGFLKINSFNDLMRIMLEIQNFPIDVILKPVLLKKDAVSRLLEAQDVLALRIELCNNAVSACYSSLLYKNIKEEESVVEYKKKLKSHLATAYDLYEGIQKELDNMAYMRMSRNNLTVPKEIGVVISKAQHRGLDVKWAYVRVDYANNIKGYVLAYRVLLKSARSTLNITLNTDEPPAGYFDTNLTPDYINRGNPVGISIPIEIESDFCFYVILSEAYKDLKEITPKAKVYDTLKHKGFMMYIPNNCNQDSKLDNTRIEPALLENISEYSMSSTTYRTWVYDALVRRGLKI